MDKLQSGCIVLTQALTRNLGTRFDQSWYNGRMTDLSDDQLLAEIGQLATKLNEHLNDAYARSLDISLTVIDRPSYQQYQQQGLNQAFAAQSALGQYVAPSRQTKTINIVHTRKLA